MKKLSFLAILSILFVSCGGEVKEAPVSDSAAVAADTVVVDGSVKEEVKEEVKKGIEDHGVERPVEHIK